MWGKEKQINTKGQITTKNSSMKNGKMLTFLYRFIILLSSKGKYPASSTNSITPHDHTSAVAPS